MDIFGGAVLGAFLGWLGVRRASKPFDSAAQMEVGLSDLMTSHLKEMLRIHILTARAMGEIAAESIKVADELAAVLVSHGVLPLDDVIGIRRRAVEGMAAVEARMREIVHAHGAGEGRHDG